MKKTFLFPLSGEVTFAQVEMETEKSSSRLATYTYTLTTKTSTRISGEMGLTIYTPRILANGLYFCRSKYLAEKEDCAIGYIYDDPLEFLDVDINPGTAVEMRDEDGVKSAACISSDARHIYQFVMKSEGEKINDHIPELKTMTFGKRYKFASLCNIYSLKLPDERITSIATFKTGNQACLGIAINNGNVLLGTLSDHHFVCKSYINFGAMDDLLLFASQKNIIVGYSKSESMLYYTGFDHQIKFTNVASSNLYNLKLSPNGEYLTALEFQGGTQTYKVHCIKLPNFDSEILCFEQPVQDFAIGHNNQICVMRNDKLEFLGSIQDLLTSLIDDKLNHRHTLFTNMNSRPITLLEKQWQAVVEPEVNRCQLM